MDDPRRERGVPEADPAEGLTDEERARASHRFVNWLQAGGIVFLAVVVLGMLPAAIASEWPALGRIATLVALIAAPAIPIGLIVVAALRLRR